MLVISWLIFYTVIMKNSIFHDKPFFYTLLQLALPIALQNLLINSLSFVDTVMIGRLGAAEIAAVGLGNQVFFMYILIMFGIGSGGAIFVAQFWGKGDILAIRKAQGFCLMLSLGAGTLFALVSLISPETVIGVFTPDPEVIRLGAAYQRITAVSYLFSAFSFVYSSVLRSVEQARLPLYMTIISLFINMLLNYLLIFGIGFFPTLGVAGAALGTTIARGIEMSLLLLVLYRPRKGITSEEARRTASPAAASLKELFAFDFPFIKQYLKTAMPVILNELAWGGGMTAYKAIYGRVSTDALASINIAETVINLLFVLLIGLGNAAAAMVGKVIGQGDQKKARQYAYRFIVIGPITGLLIGLATAAVARPVTLFFNVPEHVKNTAVAVMMLTAIWIPFKGLNLNMVIGIFRGGGDTRFGLMLDLLGVWMIGIPITLLGGLHWGLAVPLVYFLAGIEELLKCIFGLPRVFSGKWINDLTTHKSISEILGEESL